MDVKGHHRIADEVGLPLLVAAFRQRGHPRTPLNAFPLGNWLTDVQQAIDPVAVAPWADKARAAVEAINKLGQELVNSVFFRVPGPDALAGWIREEQGELARVIQAKQIELTSALEVIFAATGGTC